MKKNKSVLKVAWNKESWVLAKEVGEKEGGIVNEKFPFRQAQSVHGV